MAVSGTTRALARGAVRLARRFGLNGFIGEAPMTTAEAAVLPGTGRTTDHESNNFGTSILPACYSQHTPALALGRGLPTR
jgi:hypothetical protein